MWHTFFSSSSISLEDKFVDTESHKRAQRRLNDNKFITVIGWPGDGKSFLARKLLIHFTLSGQEAPRYGEKEDKEKYLKYRLLDEGREAFNFTIVNSVEDWGRKFDANKRQVILVEDMFGAGALNWRKLREWKPIIKDMFYTLRKQEGKTLAIFCLHKSHYLEMPGEMRTWSLFRYENLVDLADTENRAEHYETQRMLRAYVYSSGTELGNVMNNTPKGFPYLCNLFAVCRKFAMDGKKFFDNPERSLETVFGKVFEFNKIIYFALALAVMFENNLDLNKFSYEEFTEKQQELIQQLKGPLQVPLTVDMAQLRFAATKLSNIFFKCTGKHSWMFTHERLYTSMAESLYSKVPGIMIKEMSEDFFFTKFHGSYIFRDSLDMRLTIGQKNFPDFFQRFTFESLSGKMDQVCTFKGLEDEKFSKGWLNFMAEMGSLLMVIQQRVENNRSIFFWAAYHGFAEFLKAYLAHDELAEIRSEDWFKEEMKSGLLAACCGNSKNHSKTVTVLMEAGVPLETYETVSLEELEDIYGDDVAFLIQMKAPLIHFVALRGNEDCVKVLGPKVNINEASADGYTAAHRAAVNRNIYVIKEFIKLKADMHKEAPNGRKPFHLACMSENKDIVDEFVRNKLIPKDAAMFDGTSQMHTYVKLPNRYEVANMIDKDVVGPDGKYPGDFFFFKFYFQFHLCIGICT